MNIVKLMMDMVADIKRSKRINKVVKKQEIECESCEYKQLHHSETPCCCCNRGYKARNRENKWQPIKERR